MSIDDNVDSVSARELEAGLRKEIDARERAYSLGGADYFDEVDLNPQEHNRGPRHKTGGRNLPLSSSERNELINRQYKRLGLVEVAHRVGDDESHIYLANGRDIDFEQVSRDRYGRVTVKVLAGYLLEQMHGLQPTEEQVVRFAYENLGDLITGISTNERRYVLSIFDSTSRDGGNMNVGNPDYHQARLVRNGGGLKGTLAQETGSFPPIAQRSGRGDRIQSDVLDAYPELASRRESLARHPYDK